MASSESQQIFVDVFGNEIQKEGFFIKGYKFFKVDIQHKWIKVVCMGFWAQNRLYRVYLDIIPFTSIFEMKFIKEQMIFEVNSLVRDFTKQSSPVHQEISLNSFYPTLENITRTFELYKLYIHSEFISATSFNECIQYRSRLKKLTRLPEFEDLEMMYACLYLDRFKDAYEHACLYKDSLCMQEKSMRESHSRELNAISSIRLREETVRNYEIRQRMINEQLRKIDDILSSFQNHQLTPLMNEMQHRIDTSVDMCHRFFTKREQRIMGM